MLGRVSTKFKNLKKKIKYTTTAVFNSYAILFFSQNRSLGLFLMVASFFNFSAGITGLACVLFSITVASGMGYKRETVKMGIYSFNGLLLGIGFGTFYNFNVAFWLWLLTATLLCLVITVTLVSWLGKYNLPVLSVPFILSSWLLLLAANSLYTLGLDQKSSFLLEEVYHSGAGNLHALPGYFSFIDQHMPQYPALFFRALSAVIFQNNIFTGIVISAGLLFHSRIAFSLLMIGFITAVVFNGITGTYPEGISYYHLGSNFMMTCCAIGGFFLIPSWRSYLWAMISIPVVFLLVNAFSKILLVYNLPILSLPFCVVTHVLLYFFLLRSTAGKLQLTPLQHYSPERNLYQYLNGKDRLHDFQYTRLSLPFMGKWLVTQAYHGDITHKGEWSEALDFVINDEEGQSFKQGGTLPEHYYCFNKPVLACADGIIQEVIDHIEDNEIGEVNTLNNWGNSIVIKHAEDLYSQVSHLKKGSATVKSGDYVRQGEVLALCGNSGRSPVPHLHFQVQATPYIGSKTMNYPFAYFKSHRYGQTQLFKSFNIPGQGDYVSTATIEGALKNAFSFMPGFRVALSGENQQDVFEVFTNAYNETYLYSCETGATAYFINNGTVFYFTGFYGDKNSMLYYFYLAAYKVVFIADSQLVTTDVFPLQLFDNSFKRWLQDFLAPFFQFIKITYQAKQAYKGRILEIGSKQVIWMAGKKKQVMEASINIENQNITGFKVNYKGKHIQATWFTENL